MSHPWLSCLCWLQARQAVNGLRQEDPSRLCLRVKCSGEDGPRLRGLRFLRKRRKRTPSGLSRCPHTDPFGDGFRDRGLQFSCVGSHSAPVREASLLLLFCITNRDSAVGVSGVPGLAVTSAPDAKGNLPTEGTEGCEINTCLLGVWVPAFLHMSSGADMDFGSADTKVTPKRNP